MPQSIIIRRTYPWSEKSGETKITYRLMTPDDRDAILELARSLDPADAAFLRMDITDPAVVDNWVREIEIGRTVTVLAEADDKIVGYALLNHNELTWSSHLGEVRVLVEREFRRAGVGKRLIGEVYHIAKEMRLERVICHIPAAQSRVRDMFERLGFRPDAVLRGWVKDKSGRKHDLLVMSRGLIDLDG